MSKPGRNSHCPCGSGKKFKWCCFNKKLRYHDVIIDLGGVHQISAMTAGLFPGAPIEC